MARQGSAASQNYSFMRIAKGLAFRSALPGFALPQGCGGTEGEAWP